MWILRGEQKAVYEETKKSLFLHLAFSDGYLEGQDTDPQLLNSTELLLNAIVPKFLHGESGCWLYSHFYSTHTVMVLLSTFICSSEIALTLILFFFLMFNFFWRSMKLSNNEYICQSPSFYSFPCGKQYALSSLSTLVSSFSHFCVLSSVDSCSSRISFCPMSITKENCLPVRYFPVSVPLKNSSHNYSFLFSS